MGTQEDAASLHAATEAAMASQDGSEAAESVSNNKKEQSKVGTVSVVSFIMKLAEFATDIEGWINIVLFRFLHILPASRLCQPNMARYRPSHRRHSVCCSRRSAISSDGNPLRSARR